MEDKINLDGQPLDVSEVKGLNPVRPPEPNSDQAAALTSMLDWLGDEQGGSFFVLKGPAGTGKTFLVKLLTDKVKGKFVFTAPTNKAVKVLKESFKGSGYAPDCRTIYSLLGLRLEANGEIKELKASEVNKDGEKLDLSEYLLVVVDEASMLNDMVLNEHIVRAAEIFGVRFLLMGDSYQLPPVKEEVSPVFEPMFLETNRFSELRKVMRHDNQILNLVTHVREQMDARVPLIQMKSDNDGEEGVWKLSAIQQMQTIKDYARAGHFHSGVAKAIAWRNVTVDQLNRIIRMTASPGAIAPWTEDDRVTFTSPAKNFDDELFATTDEEGRVSRVQEAWHPLYPDIQTYVLAIELDSGRLVTAHVLHPASAKDFARKVEEKAAAARAVKRLWVEFWMFKESFHEIRHAYAQTAHRSQGSTYDTVFVDAGDILKNPRKRESLQCLYVALSRPRKQLFIA